MPECFASRSDRVLAALFVLLLIGGMAGYAPKAVEESHNADFERYYVAGAVALSGDDIYATGGDRQFKYFPLFAQAMMPLAWFGEQAAPDGVAVGSLPALRRAAYAWYAILCASYIGSLLLAVHLTRPETLRRALLVLLGSLVFSVRFFVGNVRNGQINMPVMFLAVLGVWLVVQECRRLGGISVAMGALIKFMPAGLLLWFARQKNVRSGVWFLTAVLLGLLVVPALTWGLRGNLDLLSGYVARRHKMVTDLPDEQAAGQSLVSMCNRLLRETNASTLRRVDEAGNPAPIYVNVVDLPEHVASGAALALVLMVTVAAWLLLPRESDRRTAALQAGLLFLLLLLISPEARRAHYVTVLVPAAALAAEGLRRRLDRRQIAAVAVAFVTLALSSQGIVGKGAVADYLNAYGITFWGGCALFYAVAHALRKPSGAG